MPQALPPPEPPAATIADRAHAIDQIDAGELRNGPRTELDELLKRVPGLQLFRRSDSHSGHPTSQGITLRAPEPFSASLSSWRQVQVP